MSNTRLLDIYLLTHNRPAQAIEAIKSVLSQADSRFRLVVSDNSDNDDLRRLIEDTKSLAYIKRPAALSGIDHGNLVLSEISNGASDSYFTLFHDDDLMLPNYVESFWRAWNSFPMP